MKRNMDLIRFLLLRSEGDESAKAECEKFTVEERAYHVQLLIDASFVEGFVRRDPRGGFTGAIISRITWNGYEFLQSVQNDKLWNKAKTHVLKAGASWTFDILKEWLKLELKKKIGLPAE